MSFRVTSHKYSSAAWNLYQIYSLKLKEATLTPLINPQDSVMSSPDPINSLIDNITASQKRKDDLLMQVKTFDTLIMAYDMEFAKLQQKEKIIDSELKETLDIINRLESENQELKIAEKNQVASRSKMLLTLQSMAVKKEEMKRLIEEELEVQKNRIASTQSKYDAINEKFVNEM